MKEEFKNNGISALDGGIDSSVTSLVVDDGAKFPASGNFRIRIDTETMLCTARSGNTLTVTRGAESTTPASHSDAAQVVHLLTSGSIFQLKRDNDAWGNTSRPVLGQIIDVTGTILTTADFTWVNQGGSSVADQDGTIYYQLAHTTGLNLRILKKAYTAPLTVVAGFVPNFAMSTNSSIMAGLCFRRSSSGRLVTIAGTQEDDKHFHIRAGKYLTETSLSSNLFTHEWATSVDPFWLKIEDNNTNIILYQSHDGINWIQRFSEARATFLVGNPDEIGFFMSMDANNAIDSAATLVHWSES